MPVALIKSIKRSIYFNFLKLNAHKRIQCIEAGEPLKRLTCMLGHHVRSRASLTRGTGDWDHNSSAKDHEIQDATAGATKKGVLPCMFENVAAKHGVPAYRTLSYAWKRPNHARPLALDRDAFGEGPGYREGSSGLHDTDMIYPTRLTPAIAISIGSKSTLNLLPDKFHNWLPIVWKTCSHAWPKGSRYT